MKELINKLRQIFLKCNGRYVKDSSIGKGIIRFAIQKDHSISHTKNEGSWDFPGGPVIKNLPSNAGDVGSIPGRGTKIPHTAGQLSPRAKTTEPGCSRAREPQLERSPCATMKIPRAATKTQCSQINK